MNQPHGLCFSVILECKGKSTTVQNATRSVRCRQSSTFSLAVALVQYMVVPEACVGPHACVQNETCAKPTALSDLSSPNVDCSANQMCVVSLRLLFL